MQVEEWSRSRRMLQFAGFVVDFWKRSQEFLRHQSRYSGYLGHQSLQYRQRRHFSKRTNMHLWHDRLVLRHLWFRSLLRVAFLERLLRGSRSRYRHKVHLVHALGPRPMYFVSLVFYRSQLKHRCTCLQTIPPKLWHTNIIGRCIWYTMSPM